MQALRKVPSVLGGNRPQTRDAGKDAFNRVQYERGEVRKLRAKLEEAERRLADAEQEREDMRAECNHCDDCSACIG